LNELNRVPRLKIVRCSPVDFDKRGEKGARKRCQLPNRGAVRVRVLFGFSGTPPSSVVPLLTWATALAIVEIIQPTEYPTGTQELPRIFPLFDLTELLTSLGDFLQGVNMFPIYP
jgi:hypothetical protein